MSRRQPYDLPKEDGAKVFWKSLADLNDPAAVQKRAESEFPLGLEEAKLAKPSQLVKLRKGKADKENLALGRRHFMMFGAASVALAAEGCARRPVEKIFPYSKAPEHVLPGVSSYYATVREHRGEALGVLVESHEGRPTKIEGNAEHPASLGATDLFAQAGIYNLYDPDRVTAPMKGTRGNGGFTTHTPTPWPELDAALADVVRATNSDRGAKLRVLMQPTNSPTMIRLRDAFRARYGSAKIHTYAPIHDTNTREGSRIAFGQVFNTLPLYSQAKVILSLDSDFLGTEPGVVRASREFAAGRKMAQGASDGMSRLYVVEPTFTNTGMNADHRLRLPAQDVERYALALAKTLAEKFAVDLGPVADQAKKADVTGIPAKWLDVVAKELTSARAKGIVVAGTRQPARVHALVHAINGALGNAGHTVTYYPAADPFEDDSIASIKELVADIDKGQVGTLVILGGNPAYDAPSDLKFAEKLKNVMNAIHVSSYLNETGELCQWVVPRTEELEAWGDQRSLDGTVSIQQPLIAPLYLGRSDIEILSRLTGEANPTGHALVQTTTKGSLGNPSNMTRQWDDALKRGRLGSALGGTRPQGFLEWKKAEVASSLSQSKASKPASPDNLEVTFAPCTKLYDGRFGNNPLLIELPDPVNKITWDNVGTISQATATALGIMNSQIVRLSREGASPIEIAMWITPGQADNTIGLALGWGRKKAGRYGDRRGFDVSPLRASDAMWFASGVKATALSAGELDGLNDTLRKVGMAAGDSPAAGRIRPNDPLMIETHVYKISQTQEHDAMEGRPIAIDTTLEEYRKNPHFPQYKDDTRKDVYLKNEPPLGDKVVDVRAKGSPDPDVLPLWGDWKEEGYRQNHRWGMGIDLTTCTGCNACVIACQIENNVPAVGKEQIWRGREMYWLRIDRYFVGLDSNDPQVVFQPLACVQCEEAPCENVCPVNATEHSPEGLNDMAYNRCIGTRYCANNCPYKVRRFNFLNYHTSGGMYDDVPESEKMHYNPNVTVRMRGVMEKCTYCVQRIQEAKIHSKRTGKAIKDKPGASPGDVIHLQAACQQACPTTAIVFGDLNDPDTEVAKWRVKDRAYRLLAELGTHPRTSYLGKIRNLNPDMGKGA